MTKREILLEVGRRLGDTSESFVTQWLAPNLDWVLKDLAKEGCLESLVRTSAFEIEENKRTYDTRVITQSGPHYPDRIESLTVYAWGPSRGMVRRARSIEEFKRRRLHVSETKRGVWDLWTTEMGPSRLDVLPPAGPDEVGVICEVEWLASPASIGLNDDLLEVKESHQETIVFGIQARIAAFKEETSADTTTVWPLYVDGRKRMWADRLNHGIKDVEARYIC